MKWKTRIRACVLVGLLVPWAAGAAESNAVSLDLQAGVPRYLDSGTLTFPLDWADGLAPAGATAAALRVKGRHYDVTATATKPATTISCTLFDAPPEPFRMDTLTATLTFASPDGKLTTSYSTTYELRPGTFARGRVLTCPTNATPWRIYRAPADVPFDTTWWPGLQGANLTWMSSSHLVTGANTQKTGLAPLNGEGGPRGAVPLEASSVPSGKYYFKIYSGSSLISDAWLDGVLGLLLIVR